MCGSAICCTFRKNNHLYLLNYAIFTRCNCCASSKSLANQQKHQHFDEVHIILCRVYHDASLSLYPPSLFLSLFCMLYPSQSLTVSLSFFLTISCVTSWYRLAQVHTLSSCSPTHFLVVPSRPSAGSLSFSLSFSLSLFLSLSRSINLSLSIYLSAYL